LVTPNNELITQVTLFNLTAFHHVVVVRLGADRLGSFLVSSNNIQIEFSSATGDGVGRGSPLLSSATVVIHRWKVEQKAFTRTKPKKPRQLKHIFFVLFVLCYIFFRWTPHVTLAAF